jgi:hypothetical protein
MAGIKIGLRRMLREPGSREMHRCSKIFMPPVRSRGWLAAVLIHWRTSRTAPLGKLFRIAALVAVTGGAALLPSLPSEAQELEQTSVEASLGASIAPGRVVVRFEPGTSDETRDQVLAEVGGVFVRLSPWQRRDVVVAKVPIGSEVSSADLLEVDTNVINPEPIIIGQSAGEQ